MIELTPEQEEWVGDLASVLAEFDGVELEVWVLDDVETTFHAAIKTPRGEAQTVELSEWDLINQTPFSDVINNANDYVINYVNERMSRGERIGKDPLSIELLKEANHIVDKCEELEPAIIEFLEDHPYEVVFPENLEYYMRFGSMKNDPQKQEEWIDSFIQLLTKIDGVEVERWERDDEYNETIFYVLIKMPNKAEEVLDISGIDLVGQNIFGVILNSADDCVLDYGEENGNYIVNKCKELKAAILAFLEDSPYEEAFPEDFKEILANDPLFFKRLDLMNQLEQEDPFFDFEDDD